MVHLVVRRASYDCSSGPGAPKSSYSAVNHERTIIFQIFTGKTGSSNIDRIVGRVHRNCAPYLLTLERQDNNLASGVYYAQGGHPALYRNVVMEKRQIDKVGALFH